MAHILIIDDEKNIRKMVRLTLEKSGHSVEVAEDGQHGLNLFCEGEGWDLVLTDQRMPGIEGRDVTREVRRRDPAARIVMMTSFATLELATDVLQAGATDFLRKPFSAETLRGAITAALARPRQKAIAMPKEGRSQTGDEEPKTFLNGLITLPRRPMAVPLIHFYFNGYTFWPVAATDDETQNLWNFPVRQAFQLRGPNGESGRCIVGVTLNVVTQVRSQNKRGDSDFMWEMVCRESLINFLWDKAIMPPAVLPIYELSSRQLDDIGRLQKAGSDDFEDG